MTIKRRNFYKGVRLTPTTDALTVDGEVSANSSDNKLKAQLGGSTRNVVTEDQSQTLTNKTINADNNTISNLEVDNLKSGVLDTDLNAVSGADDTIPSAKAVKAYVDAQIDTIDQAAEITYSNATSGLAATNVQTAIDEIDGNVDNLVTLSGVALDAVNLGTFTGTTIPDNQTNKQALQALETSVETKAASSVVTEIDGNVDDLITLSGVAENSTSLGTFTGTTIPDSSTIKAALQALETSVETKATSAVVTEIDGNVNDLITLSGVAENATNLGTFTGTTIADNSTVKTALQSLETSVETKATGAASSTDNAISRFDGTTGKTIQNSLVTIDDAGIMSGATQLNVDNLRLDGNVLSSTSGNLDLTSAGIINANQTIKFFSDVIADITTDSATGSNATITDPASKIIRLTNASLVSLGGIPAGLEGQHLTIINATGNSVIINDNTGATAANRILTGQKSNIILKDESSIHLEYDSTETRWMVIGGVGSSSGQGGINYIDNPDFEVNTTGWITFDDGAAVPVDGTGGTVTSTFTRSTSSPLRDTASGLFSKPASNVIGEGVSYDFSIDNADKAKVLEISFDYEATANFVDGYSRCYIYDITNASIIEPSQRDILANAGQAKYLGYFQSASNSTSYRLILITATSTTTAWDLKIDNVKVGPSDMSNRGTSIAFKVYLNTAANHTAISAAQKTPLDTVQYDTVGGWDATNTRWVAPESGYYSLQSTTTFGSIADGKVAQTNIYVNGAVSLRGSFVPNGVAGQSVFSVASGISYLNKGDYVESYGFQDDSASEAYSTGSSRTFLSGILIKPETVSANSLSNVSFSVRPGAQQTGINTNNSSVKLTQYSNILYDTAGGFDTTNNQYVIPDSGKYHFSAHVRILGTNVLNNLYGLTITQNSSVVVRGGAIYPTAGAEFYVSIAGDVDCVKGDIIELQLIGLGNNSVSTISTSSTGLTTLRWSGHKIATSALIPPTEKIVAIYNTNAATSLASGGSAKIVDFEDRVTDTHNAVTTGVSWKFTAPISDYYTCSFGVGLQSSPGWSGAEGFICYFYKNGVVHTEFYDYPNGGGVDIRTSISNTRVIYLAKGDTVDVRTFQNSGGAITYNPSEADVWISIKN